MFVAKQSLSYAIQNQGEFVVIALRGALTRESSAILENFQKELDGKEGHYFILSLAGLTDVDHIMMPRLIRLQKAVRERQGRLQLYVPNADLLQSLEYAGAVRKDELAPSPTEAMLRLRAIAERDQSPEAREARRQQALENATAFERAVAGLRDPGEDNNDDEREEENADKQQAAPAEQRMKKDEGPREPTEGERLFPELKVR